jgi:CTP:molybdopterin cytidylyltransferase MocA
MLPSENHLAVIMARGESLRMGRPKGLCRLVGEKEPFVVGIFRQYQSLGIPVLLVLNSEHESAYRQCLEADEIFFHPAPGGDDTAQTMAIALAWAEKNMEDCACLWAHPVDLPLVQRETLSALWSTFDKAPDLGLRPYHQDNPGHPVLLPAVLLARVLGQDHHSGTMAQVWRSAIARGTAGPIRALKVNDPGVINDFDHPDQLGPDPETKESSL